MTLHPVVRGTMAERNNCSHACLQVRAYNSQQPAPCEVVDAAFGGVVARDGWDGGDAVDGRHVDDGAAAALAHPVLLLHLPPHRLAALQVHERSRLDYTLEMRPFSETLEHSCDSTHLRLHLGGCQCTRTLRAGA